MRITIKIVERCKGRVGSKCGKRSVFRLMFSSGAMPVGYCALLGLGADIVDAVFVGEFRIAFRAFG